MYSPKFTKCKPGSFLDLHFREKFGQAYIEFVEEEVDEPVTMLSGPEFEFEEDEA